MIEKRREPRFKAGHSALLTAPNKLPVEAWVMDVSASGAKLRIPAPLAVGATVKIEAEELLLFGTIIRCEKSEGAYYAGIALSRSLEMLTELGKLNECLLKESAAPVEANVRA